MNALDTTSTTASPVDATSTTGTVGTVGTNTTQFARLAALFTLVAGYWLALSQQYMGPVYDSLNALFHVQSGNEGLTYSPAWMIPAALSALFSGYPHRKWGTRKSMVGACMLFALGSFVHGFSSSLNMFDVGSILVGLAVGIFSSS